MARVHDKVNATEFTVETGHSDDQIRQAGRHAMESGKRLMTNTVNEERVAPGRIDYVIKGPGNLVTQMRMTVTWEDAVAGERRKVRLKVVDFMTAQSTMMLIPLGPKSAPALTSAQRFAQALRRELATT